MTTYADPAAAVQTGIYERLSTDATLDVYDDVPEGASKPYVVIGECTSVEDSAHGSPGRSTDATIHTWTEALGFASGNAIAARVVALLAKQHAALDAEVTGHKVWRVDHEFSQTLRDPDPNVRHRVDRFRIWTRQEA